MTPEQFAAALATSPELRLATARTLDAYMSLWRGLTPRQRETTLALFAANREKPTP